MIEVYPNLDSFKKAEKNQKVLSRHGEMRRKFKKRDKIAYAIHMADEAKQMYPERQGEINKKTQRFMSKYYKKQGYLSETRK